MFNGLTVLSLVLCVATIALWVRSHWRLDALFFPVRSHYYSESQDGTLHVLRPARGWGRTPIRWWHGSVSFTKRQKQIDNSGHNHPFAWLGFAYDGDMVYQGTHLGQQWYFPDWFVCLLLAILPVVWLRRWRRDRRLRNVGHCRFCGYNLTGNVSGVCPECGKPIENVVRAK
jgi:hypothetical protein